MCFNNYSYYLNASSFQKSFPINPSWLFSASWRAPLDRFNKDPVEPLVRSIYQNCFLSSRMKVRASKLFQNDRKWCQVNIRWGFSHNRLSSFWETISLLMMALWRKAQWQFTLSPSGFRFRVFMRLHVLHVWLSELLASTFPWHAASVVTARRACQL